MHKRALQFTRVYSRRLIIRSAKRKPVTPKYR